ncbi:hypothetical protein BCR35DRAFT_196627 [Leucosporidium creatinivorum]|uniref:Uncharacterized protein n=1 Tax=Leucosporidium creatinivorum TaxID=106004 RepID=A0A1Y2DPM8_9BASI|nr:hypothetical protein BCR35DRAFT_196627 [Leucosporidium creatinivorum]
MAPSLLQTLLRQPSQSYSSRTSPSPSLYDVSLHSSSQSRRTSSLRSSQSRDSSRSGGGGDWSNGQWEWAQYGGRAGLTKGPSSIHPSEVASALGVPGETRRSSSRQSSSRRGASRSESGTADEDTRSLRSQQSSKSLSSVRSSGSRSQPTWSSPAEATLRTNPRPSSQSSASRRYSSTDAAPSRRYSSLSPAPSNSSSSASTRRTSSASPSPSSEAPSLVSSLSSAPSSPPITPIHATPLALPLPPLDPPKSKRTKKQRAPREVVDIAAQQQHEDRGLEMVQEATEEEERRRSWVEPHEQVTALSEEAIEHGARTAERVEDEALVSSQTMGVLDKFAAPEPTLLDPSPRKSRQYYSVDEFFTLATGNPEPALTFPSPPSPTSSLAAPASETETEKTTVLNDSIERSTSPADQLVSATSSQEVPRIRLTRTESDQSAAGVKGDVEVPSDEEEEEADVPAPISTNITRKRTKRRPTTSDSPASTQPPTTIEVVASSSSSPSRSRSASPLPTTTPILHTPSSSADPAWLTRIRALGEPIEPLIQMPPPRSSKSSRSATPEPHWTVRQYEQRQKELKEQREREQPVRRPSSLGNLRRPRNVMEPMPEMDEGEVEVEVEVEQREEKVAEEKPVILAPPQMRRSASLNTGSPSTAPGDKARRSDSRTSMREGSSAGRPLSPAPEVAIAEERAPRRRTQSAIEPSPSSYYPPPTIAPHSGPISPSSRSSSISPAPTSHSQPLTCDALSAVSGPASQDLYDDEEEDDAPSLYSQTSTSRYSTMSVPTGAFSRPPKNPARNRNINRASMPSMPLDAAAMVLHHSPSPAPTKSNPNLMFTLSISASALARPSQGSSSNSSSFNPFKRTGGPSIEPPLSSSQTHSRRFSPVRDLTHSALSPLPSPKKLKSDEVLVEVIAVGLEGDG